MQDLTPGKLTFAGGTHRGLCREVNEDNFCYIDYPEEVNHLAVVADGIGGHRDGQFASMFCCSYMIQAWRKSNIGNESDPAVIQEFLRKAVDGCNQELFRQNQLKTPGKPMGTTIVAAVFMPDQVIVFHAGDSRMYAWSENLMERWTRDHSLVMELVKKNIITQEEMGSHPYSHVILSSIGPSLKLKLDINRFEYRPGLRFILCSDGVTRHLSDSQLSDILKSATSPKAAIEQIIRDTLRAGAEDNIAVICVF
jgi:serine/threonine protein phosphatase PrpC